MSIIRFFLVFLFLLTFVRAQAAEEYRIGVLAKRGEAIALARWQATADYLHERMPRYAFTIVPLGFDQIHESVQDGTIDFIIANSAYYIDVEMNYGVQRIATLKNVYPCDKCATLFGGVIFTRADRDDINTLQDIVGKRFAAVDPRSFGGWHAAYYEFVKDGINPPKDFTAIDFAGTHDNVVYRVLENKDDAGTVRTETIEKMVQEGKIQSDAIKVIHQHPSQDGERLLSTMLYPEWPFAKLPHIKNSVAEKIALALIAMPPESEAAKKAKIKGWTIPQNYQPIHECLKAIKVGPYKDYGKITLTEFFYQYWYLVLGLLLLIAAAGITSIHITRLNRDLQTKQAKIVKLNSELQVDINKQKKLLDSVTNSINDLIFYKDKEFRYIGANKAFESFIGRPIKSIIGKNDFEIFDKETAELFRRMDTTMFEKGTSNSNNEWVVYPDGSRHYLHTVKSPLITEEGELIGLVGISRDTTDYKLMTDELESYKTSLEQRVRDEIDKRREKEELLSHQSKQVAMGEMIENIAHQWRQPINALGLVIQDIKDAYEYKELDKAFIDKSSATAMTIINKMSQTIDDFRNFFKQDKEQKEFYLKDVVEEALVITGSALKNNRIDVQVIEHKHAKAFGYANEYSQVVMNILNNAKDALKKHKSGERTIRIEIDEDDDGKSLLTVTDSGDGIDPAIIDKVFDAHFTTKTSDEGTGIGLYMSQVIIEKHMHGSIRAANSKEGGAAFTITL